MPDGLLFEPGPEHEALEEWATMQQGQGQHDLRDPFLLTEEGHDWLREHGAEGEIDDHRQ
jgi:hypothetical protein